MSEHESPVVSVVVPFYDVEECVDDCMRSLLCQDFDRYEVLCVDDGSRDRTSELLDGYAATDPRVRVIRTDNRGLSEARNAGVRAARAPLVSFVDGDDVVSPHYLRLLYVAHDGAPGRMVVGRTRGVSRDEVESVEWQSTTQGRLVLSRNDAIRRYLRWDLGFVAWGRLASRDLYLRAPFEPGVLYEDSYAFPSHLSALDEVVLLDVELYGYIPRKGSLSNPRVLTNPHLEGKLRTIEHFCAVALTWPPELRRLSVWRLDRHLLRLAEFSSRLADRRRAKPYGDLARSALARDLPWLLRTRREERLSWQLPAASVIAVVSPHLLCTIDRIRRRHA